MEIIPVTKIDIGDLLLETVKNSMYVDAELQKTIAQFVRSVPLQPPKIIQPDKETQNEA